MKKSYKNIFDKERRDFLKILASAGISKQLLRASPLVWGTMYARLAEAQTIVDKCVIVYVPDGCIASRFFPNSTLSDLTAGSTSLPMSAPYAGIKSQCHFLRDMSHHNAGHGACSRVINWEDGGESFDINIGRVLSGSRPFMYVNLGVMPGDNILSKINAARRQHWGGSDVPPETSPVNAFRRLFSGSSSSSSSGGNPKQALIDSHREAVNALKTKLGTYERVRLDSHLAAIAALESRLGLGSSSSSTSSSGACAAGSEPAQYPLTNDNFERAAQDMALILATALSCNLTASASLLLGDDQGQFAMPYLPGFQGIYHNSIHGGNNGDTVNWPHFSETRAHISKQSANVISQLNAKNLLNSTIFMEVTDMGDGNSHTGDHVPLIMAGAGSRITKGVSNAGGPSYTPLNMLATAGAILNAQQSPNYDYGQFQVIPGIIV
jgi:hypothetical protein